MAEPTYQVFATHYPYGLHPEHYWETEHMLVFVWRFIRARLRYEIVDCQISFRNNRKMDRIERSLNE